MVGYTRVCKGVMGKDVEQSERPKFYLLQYINFNITPGSENKNNKLFDVLIFLLLKCMFLESSIAY